MPLTSGSNQLQFHEIIAVQLRPKRSFIDPRIPSTNSASSLHGFPQGVSRSDFGPWDQRTASHLFPTVSNRPFRSNRLLYQSFEPFSVANSSRGFVLILATILCRPKMKYQSAWKSESDFKICRFSYYSLSVASFEAIVRGSYSLCPRDRLSILVRAELTICVGFAVGRYIPRSLFHNVQLHTVVHGIRFIFVVQKVLGSVLFAGQRSFWTSHKMQFRKMQLHPPPCRLPLQKGSHWFQGFFGYVWL